MDNVLMTEVFVLSKPDESCLFIENQKKVKIIPHRGQSLALLRVSQRYVPVFYV